MQKPTSGAASGKRESRLSLYEATYPSKHVRAEFWLDVELRLREALVDCALAAHPSRPVSAALREHFGSLDAAGLVAVFFDCPVPEVRAFAGECSAYAGCAAFDRATQGAFNRLENLIG